MFRQILIFGLAGLLMVTTASTADAQMRRWAGRQRGPLREPDEYLLQRSARR